MSEFTLEEQLKMCEARGKWWNAAAMLAACGKVSLNQLLLKTTLYHGWSYPQKDELDKIIKDAQDAVLEATKGVS